MATEFSNVASYDYEEGIRKHTQYIYGPVLGVIDSQGIEIGADITEKEKDKDRYFEDYKKEHEERMKQWKIQML
jgi:hypothetical protein